MKESSGIIEIQATSVDVAARVAKSERLSRWFDEKIGGVARPLSLRSRLARGSLDMALEHQKAIVMLVAARLYGSALALVRLIFEAFIRGAWLHQCALDEDLWRFKKDNFDKRFGDLIKDLEKLEAFDCGVLLKAKQASWAAMNSYTHTGFHQVVRRNIETTSETNYSAAEIIEAIGFIDAIAVMSAIEIAHIAGNDALANEIFTEVKDNFLQDGR